MTASAIGAFDEGLGVFQTLGIRKNLGRYLLRRWSHDVVGRRRYGGVGRRSGFGLFVVRVGLILALYRVQRIVDGKMGHGVGTRP